MSCGLDGETWNGCPEMPGFTVVFVWSDHTCFCAAQGRDANRKLQRAIRAGKLRERLPAMLAELRQLLVEWRDTEGEPFLYDGADYEVSCLSSKPFVAAVTETESVLYVGRDDGMNEAAMLLFVC
eukprot:GHRR01031283.1.p1 GENE.GHRR01031283.1~~GHRR01031283.1.p1  ORF type:complete len:125 (-),score=39.44 GHRR01031283.1:335-709(-)